MTDPWPLAITGRLTAINLDPTLKDPHHAFSLFAEHLRCERDYLQTEITYLERLIQYDAALKESYRPMLLRLGQRLIFVRRQLENINSAVEYVSG